MIDLSALIRPALAMLKTGTYPVYRTPGPLPTVKGRAVAAVLADDWQPLRDYTVDTTAANAGNAYVCMQNGLSGTAEEGGPSGVGTGIADGACLWDWIGPALSVLQVDGVEQPLRGVELDRLAELYRTREVRRFYTPELLRATDSEEGPADEVEIDGKRWPVQTLEGWDKVAGYWKALLVRPGH